MSSYLKEVYQRFIAVCSGLVINPPNNNFPYLIIVPTPLTSFPYSNNIENDGSNLYFTNNSGVREKIITPSLIDPQPLQQQKYQNLISFDDITTSYVDIFQFTISETGVYKLNLKLKLNVVGSTNLYIKLLENGSLMNIRKNTAVETSEEIIPVTTNNPLYIDIYKNIYLSLTQGNTYTFQVKTSIANTITRTSQQLLTLERIKNYSVVEINNDETGGI